MVNEKCGTCVDGHIHLALASEPHVIASHRCTHLLNIKTCMPLTDLYRFTSSVCGKEMKDAVFRYLLRPFEMRKRGRDMEREEEERQETWEREDKRRETGEERGAKNE